MKALHIAVTSPSYAPCVGGAERLLQGVMEQLARRGHRTTVITFDVKTQRDFLAPVGAGLPARETINDVEIVRVHPVAHNAEEVIKRIARIPGGWRALQQWFSPDPWFPIDRPSGYNAMAPLRQARPDVVGSINWGYGLSFWTHRAARRMGRPHVAIPIFHAEREWTRNPVYPMLLRHATGAIVCTEAEGEFVRARGGQQAWVAGAGVDPSAFLHPDGRRVRERFGIGDAPVVGFIGRQVAIKGMLVLLDAMERLWAQGTAAHLLLAGPSAHRGEDVRTALDALAPARRSQVHLMDDFAEGERADVFAACDIVTLPSDDEAFGMVYVEAWMCRRPVVGVDMASTRCLIADGVDGYLMRPGDAGHLAELIRKLIESPATREQMGRRGREKGLERYTWERVTDVWEEAFTQAVR